MASFQDHDHVRLNSETGRVAGRGKADTMIYTWPSATLSGLREKWHVRDFRDYQDQAGST